MNLKTYRIFFGISSIFDYEIDICCAVGNVIQFRFEVGNGIQTLEQTTAYPMNDDEWHTIHIERNRKQAMLQVRNYRTRSCKHPRRLSYVNEWDGIAYIQRVDFVYLVLFIYGRGKLDIILDYFHYFLHKIRYSKGYGIFFTP